MHKKCLILIQWLLYCIHIKNVVLIFKIVEVKKYFRGRPKCYETKNTLILSRAADG
jgi:hypothetical protein